MGFNPLARTEMVGHLASLIDRLSLHSGDPGAGGANELVGGTPAYARQIVTWGVAAGGQVYLATVGSHQVPGGSTVMAVGFWDNVATPNFYGYAPLGQFLGVFAAVDTVVDAIHIPGHGQVLNNPVSFQPVVGKALPAPLVEFTPYYVRDVTTDTFKVAATPGGTAINITGVGSGMVYSLVAESYPVQGVYTVTPALNLAIR